MRARMSPSRRKGLADGEDHLKDPDHDDQEEERSPDAVEQEVVDLARALDRKGRR